MMSMTKTTTKRSLKLLCGTLLATSFAAISACSADNGTAQNNSASNMQSEAVSGDIQAQRAALASPYTSDPFSMLQLHGKPQLTEKAQKYWDVFTPDMDPAIQCLPSTLARDLYSPAGILVEIMADSNIKLSNETVFMDDRDFPAEYAMDKRGNWPVSDMGYSIGSWDGATLKVETRGVVERDILMGHIPILPSDQLIIKREMKLIPVEERWEARGLAPQEVNYFSVPDDQAKTIQMDVWLNDPVNLKDTWHTVKHYREVTSSDYVTTGGDAHVDASANPEWEGTDLAANSGVPEEFLANYDGGCVLFPEYDETGAGDVEAYIPK